MLALLAAYLVFGEFDESDPAQNGSGADSSTASQTADENNGLSENGATQFQAENTDEEELAKRYYYSQLDENRQMIYRELVQGIAGFMIQGGDPKGTGTDGPGYHIKGEFANNGFKTNDISHKRGVLSMARAQMPDSAGSQFFVMHADGEFLDGDYAAFGAVIEGMETVDEIAAAKTDWNDRPREEQKIKKATAETFGAEYEEPAKA